MKNKALIFGLCLFFMSQLPLGSSAMANSPRQSGPYDSLNEIPPDEPDTPPEIGNSVGPYYYPMPAQPAPQQSQTNSGP